MPLYADAREIEKLALTLSKVALQCRDLGHAWRTRNVETDAGGYKRTFRCTRGCGTIRIQKLDRSARIKSNSYEYPKHGYLFDQPVGRIVGDAKAAIRLTAIYADLERIDGANSETDMRSLPRGGGSASGAGDADSGRQNGRGRSVRGAQKATTRGVRKPAGNRAGSKGRRSA